MTIRPPPDSLFRVAPTSVELNGKIAEISFSHPQVGGGKWLTNDLLLLLLLRPSVAATLDNLNYSSDRGHLGVIKSVFVAILGEQDILRPNNQLSCK